MIPALEIKVCDGYVEAEVTKQNEIILRVTDLDDLVVGVIMNDQQVRWLIDYLSKHVAPRPEVGDSGYCPHCGADQMSRCLPPRDYTQCAFYRRSQPQSRIQGSE